jgi:uncharacterized membrane protein
LDVIESIKVHINLYKIGEDIVSFLKLVKNRTEEINTPTNAKSQTSNLDMFAQFVCHRIPERTFNIRGHYFPICSRCTGLYIGAFSYFIYVYFFYVQYTTTLIILAILVIIPTFLDGFTQFIGSRACFIILLSIIILAYYIASK